VSFDPRNILVIHFGQLGDVVLSLPALSAVRKRFPNAKITAIVGKPSLPIVEMSRAVDSAIAVDRVSLKQGNTLVSIGRIIKLVKSVRNQGFDFVIDLHSLSETNLLGLLSGAPHRLYAHRPSRSIELLSNFQPRAPREDLSKHAVDRYLDVIQPLGISAQSRIPRITTNAADDAVVELLLKKESANSNTLLVGLFIGAGHVLRRWAIERYAELADSLIRNDQVRVIVFAGPEEKALLSQARKLFPSTTIFFDRLTIPQLVSAQARLTLFISNDTGPMHLAAAAGTPVIVLLDRPTTHAYVPLGDQHRILTAPKINEISVDRVYEAAHELLAINRTQQIFSRADLR
jgi:ADP-heptose:LPS heptosyltransferase